MPALIPVLALSLIPLLTVAQATSMYFFGVVKLSFVHILESP